MAGLALAGLTLATAIPAAHAQQTPQPAPADQPAQPKPKPKPKKPAPSPADAPPEKAKLLEKIKDWAVFIHETDKGRICFAASAPTEMQPKAAKRSSVIFYLTTWQKDGVRNEVSVKQGHVLKAGAGNAITVGSQTFALLTDEDKAFIKDAADERKLLAAMAAGGTMSVKSTPAKGSATTDQYSLDGLADAVKRLQTACP
jgi:invasion protein IalB